MISGIHTSAVFTAKNGHIAKSPFTIHQNGTRSIQIQIVGVLGLSALIINSKNKKNKQTIENGIKKEQLISIVPVISIRCK